MIWYAIEIFQSRLFPVVRQMPEKSQCLVTLTLTCAALKRLALVQHMIEKSPYLNGSVAFIIDRTEFFFYANDLLTFL